MIHTTLDLSIYQRVARRRTKAGHCLIRKIDFWESSFENLYSYLQKCEPHFYEFIFLMSLHDIWWNRCECSATMTGFQRRGVVTKSCQHQCSLLCRRLYVHNENIYDVARQECCFSLCQQLLPLSQREDQSGPNKSHRLRLDE